ncbi:hypothetical protein Tco_0984599 [Tanacetum coccineum]
MDDPNITMEEYIRLEEEKARRHGEMFNCTPNENKIDFRISLDESDDEDYTVIFDENSFSYKIISVNDLETDSENDNDNMPSSPKPSINCLDDLDRFSNFKNKFPAIVYNDGIVSKPDPIIEHFARPQPDHKNEASLPPYDKMKQNVLCHNDLFDLSNGDNDDKIVSKQS